MSFFSKILNKLAGGSNPEQIPPARLWASHRQNVWRKHLNAECRKQKNLRDSEGRRCPALLRSAVTSSEATSAFAIHLSRDGQVGLGDDPTQDV